MAWTVARRSDSATAPCQTSKSGSLKTCQDNFDPDPTDRTDEVGPTPDRTAPLALLGTMPPSETIARTPTRANRARTLVRAVRPSGLTKRQRRRSEPLAAYLGDPDGLFCAPNDHTISHKRNETGRSPFP